MSSSEDEDHFTYSFLLCRSFFSEIVKRLQLIISWSQCNKTYVSMLDFIKMPLISARGCGKGAASMYSGFFFFSFSFEESPGRLCKSVLLTGVVETYCK